LEPLLAAVLEERQREYHAQGYNETADVLAQMASSNGVARFVGELRRESRTRAGYYWPTVAADFWRDVSFRKRLQKDPRHAAALVSFRWAAHHEAAARAVYAADVLCWLAEAVTQPDERTRREIDKHKRKFEQQRRAYQLLCAEGLEGEAKPQLVEAAKHLWLASRKWNPDRGMLLRANCRKLAGLFLFGGKRIAAGLVAAALNEPIFYWHTRHAVKKIRR
jgi:hypothetical protein